MVTTRQQQRKLGTANNTIARIDKPVIRKRKESFDGIPEKPKGMEKMTPNDIGDELEEDTYQILKDYGPTQRTTIGYHSKREKKYVITGDGGIDLIMELREIIVLVQCKNWGSKVRTKDVREFVGAIQKWDKTSNERIIGLMVTNKNGYTEGALNEPNGIKIPVILTTLQNLRETVVNVLLKLKGKAENTVKIGKSEYTYIEGNITVIKNGENVEIYNE